MKRDGERKRDISSAAWNVYLHILTSREPVGVREIWRELNLSSPSLAQYHVNRLLELGMIIQTDEGKYAASEEKRVEALKGFLLVYGKLVPRLVFYGAFVVGVLAVYLLVWPFEMDLRDLTVIAVSVFSIFAFFSEAYVQYHTLRAGVQQP